MNFKARSTYTPVDLSRAQAKIVPALTAAVTEAVGAIANEARAICPVDSGALSASIGTDVEWTGTRIDGYVTAGGGDVDYAAYVEFGTGERGAASPGAGPYSYGSQPGMVAQPYMRPALDTARPEVRAAFASRGFKIAA